MTKSRRSIGDSGNEDVPEPESHEDEDDEEGNGFMTFSSQAPELTQEIRTASAKEKDSLMKLGEEVRENVIGNVARAVLFKAAAGEPIERAQILKDAIPASQNLGDKKFTDAVFEEVNQRLRNIFDFELRRLPAWMEKLKIFPNKYKNRYYLVNDFDDPDGSHSKAIHGIHRSSSIQKGVLMVTLALVYCKGEAMADGSRWILDKDLYRLMHTLDDNLPSEPPVKRTRKRNSVTQDVAVEDTPQLDSLLESFVQHDYLVREAKNEHLMSIFDIADEESVFYSLGPRAAIEVGRKQIIYFCAEILDEPEPDETMLKELEEDEQLALTA